MDAIIEKQSKGLKEYADFLLKNHVRDIAVANLELARKANVPLLQFFNGLSEEQLVQIGIQGLEKYLGSIKEGRVLEETLNSLEDYKNDQVPGIPREMVEISDLVLVYTHRNRNIRKFLPEFTSDVSVVLKIVEELELLKAKYTERAFEVFLEIQKDILEGKNNQVRESEAQLKEAQEIGGIGSWSFDLANNVVSWSDELYRLLGYQPGEIEVNYEKYLAHVFKDDKKLVDNAVNNILDDHVPYSFEHRINRKDNTVRWFIGRGKVVEKDGDRVLKISGTAQDITEEKKYQEELEQRQKSLVAVNKELEAFCYTISHDLRSPLRAIDGFGKMLHEDYSHTLDKEGCRILEVIRSNATFMGSLIDDLLEFSRLNRKELVKSRIDMRQMALSVFEELKQAYPETKAVIEVESLPCAYADKTMMHQVWQNLIGNALKFTMKKGNPKVEVGFEEKGGEIIYFIKDNGAGFDRKYIDKLFGVFQRLHSMEEFPGTGVGLATVKRIILRNGGTVWAEGKLNQGATFFFTLPKK